MFRPDQPQLYFQNSDDQPDFGSILITMDSKLIRREDEHVTQKFLASTQSCSVSLIALLAYYGEPQAIGHPDTVNMLMEAARASDPVFVYVTPREGQVEVLMATDTFEGLHQHQAFGNGSLLLLSEKINDVVARMVADFQMANEGSTPRLFFFDVGASAEAAAEELNSEDAPLQEERVDDSQEANLGVT